MIELNLKDMPKDTHDQLYKGLENIIEANKENKKIKFIAECTKQALVRVPNDESEFQSFFRRFKKVSEGINNLRGAVNDKDPSKLVDAYQCFKESFTFQNS